MISSKDPKALIPIVYSKYEKFADQCSRSHIDIIVTSTYRDLESQGALYSIGRTIKGEDVDAKNPMGKIVTNAKPGNSFHQYRVAFDVVPIIHGKPVWNNKQLWESIGAIAKACGLEWAGDWKKFKEKCHLQYTSGLTLKDFKNGKIPTQ
jgi:peptidoglycan L-alanyl-D-glutamate endopeptidase CwlK